MGNTLQNNPSDATDNFEQPDWNSKHGTGVEPSKDDSVDLNEVYEKQRQGAKDRVNQVQAQSQSQSKSKSGDNSNNE